MSGLDDLVREIDERRGDTVASDALAKVREGSNEPNTFVVTRTSTRGSNPIEFASLDEFIEWVRALNEQVVVTAEWGNPQVTVEIYDDYRE